MRLLITLRKKNIKKQTEITDNRDGIFTVPIFVYYIYTYTYKIHKQSSNNDLYKYK